jgi:hypothetical protein
MHKVKHQQPKWPFTEDPKKAIATKLTIIFGSYLKWPILWRRRPFGKLGKFIRGWDVLSHLAYFWRMPNRLLSLHALQNA